MPTGVIVAAVILAGAVGCLVTNNFLVVLLICEIFLFLLMLGRS